MDVESENRKLRELLWLRHGCKGLYGDDGEIQCNKCMIDFKRHSVEIIEAKFYKMGVDLLTNYLKKVKPFEGGGDMLNCPDNCEKKIECKDCGKQLCLFLTGTHVEPREVTDIVCSVEEHYNFPKGKSCRTCVGSFERTLSGSVRINDAS